MCTVNTKKFCMKQTPAMAKLYYQLGLNVEVLHNGTTPFTLCDDPLPDKMEAQLYTFTHIFLVILYMMSLEE